MTLLLAEVRTLLAANEALSKRRRAKKARIRQGGALTVKDAQDILAQKDVNEQVQHEKRSREDRQNEGQTRGRRCSTCGRTGHYAPRCPKAVNVSSPLDSK
ncbi:hypothetical protein V502_00361 [Pseudogymnoascus sp. VKM F-4520 (FW-2644)]|nr:hypothetical protein V502_00361 [Pseudogymnoascus sp. VKM F-4520 (FW-2644)]